MSVAERARHLPPSPDPGYIRAIAAISALAAVIRLMFLWRPPLWRDEAFTATVVSGRSVLEMLDAIRHDSAPPLAYLLIHVIAMVSPAPAALRLVSVVAGVVAVPVAAALGHRCSGRRGGIFAAATIAVTPAFVTSSRDARMYALATTLVMLCALCLWRAIAHPSPARLLTYAAAVALATYTQYFAALAIAAMVVSGIALLGPTRGTTIRVLAATIGGGATLLPWLVAALPQFQHVDSPFWVQPLGITTAGGVVSQFLSGTPVDAGTPQKLALQVLQALAVAGGAAGALGLAGALRRRPSLRLPAAFLAGGGLGGIALLTLLSVRHPLLDARYASVLWGPLAVLVGVGLAEIRWRAVPAAALTAMLASALTLSVAHLHPDTPQAAAYLDTHVRSADYVSATAEQYQLMQYYGDDRTRRLTHITANHVDWFWGTAAFPPDAVVKAVPASVETLGGRVFTVGNTTDGPPALPPAYALIDRQCWVGICVNTYGRTR